ncbi:hypothetical protein [Caldimonas tepidiphila]|uniref:hypothetical protein n=1 Tax=Caldimonas tepidiphila TaxID=2315841 RepID=UPI000E5A9C25|nr:hypothetical protein [Caldimonas tepidiphila]
MKERPILFSAPMVRALLAGTKTQTRRVVKPQPFEDRRSGGWAVCDRAGAMRCWTKELAQMSDCPYGQPGDRLWVKETHLAWWSINPEDPKGPRVFSHVAAFAADGYELEPGERWIPSIHMRRAASRLTLEITGVRVERLQDISEEDAKAEGVGVKNSPAAHLTTYRRGYRDLWEQINGAGSWDANPWVWVVEFRRAAA